jgi:HK97 family phage prohead protease
MTMTDHRAPDVPREDLIRMTTTLRHAEDGNVLFGYPAVFNEWTEIDSWEGMFKERIAPGSFRKTLQERGDQVKVLFNHGMDPQIGSKPLGKPTVQKEDNRGLYGEVPLDPTTYNADIKALLRSGALDGMSIRFTVLQEEWANLDAKDGSLPERTIKEARLYEWGPVTFPAYTATQAGVRAHAPDAFEAWRSATPMTERTTRSGVVPDKEDQPKPLAGEDATDENTQDSGPGSDSTRSETGDEPETYQPAQRAPMSRERRESQLGSVKAWLAKAESRNT